MNIVTLNKSELLQFINSDEFNTMPYIPISYIRAVSHINNPRANENDILLILVYLDFGLAGYLGIVSDLIFKNDKPEKVGWMSCIWVHQNARGKGLAKTLTNKAIELWDNKILATEFTPVAYNLYQKLKKFNILTIKDGLRIYRRSCTKHVLTSRYNKAKYIKPILATFDFTINIVNDLFIKKKHNLINQNIKIENITNIDDDIFNFIKKHQDSNLFNRNKSEINWLLKFPWVKETHSISPESIKYQFTSEAKQFKNICIKIIDNNLIVGFVLLTIRDKHLKTPYIFIEKGVENTLVFIINNIMMDYNIDILTTYQNTIINNKNLSFIFRKSINRIYLTTMNPIAIGFNVNQNNIQDGDGDCAFV